MQNLHFEAFCIEHRIDYRNPTFNNGHLYISPCSVKTNSFIKYLSANILEQTFQQSNIIKKIFSFAWLLSKSVFVKYIDFDRVNIDKDRKKILLKAFEKKNTVYVSGWKFRVSDLIEKNRIELVKRYSLKPEFYENNNLYKKIIKIKKQENILIGIHIRRGDYKNWLGGKYYFEDEVYEAYMKEFLEKLSKETDKNQVFIIFSNDNVKFLENDNILISKECWYIDHHLMSLCDYLIGTHSTFTLWASYIGGNTFFSIRDNSGKIENTVSDFRENDMFHIFGEKGRCI